MALAIREQVQSPSDYADHVLTLGAGTQVGDLIVLIQCNAWYEATNLLTPTGTAVSSWTLRHTMDGGTNDTHAKVWTGLVTTGGASTVDVNSTTTDEERFSSVWVISGGAAYADAQSTDSDTNSTSFVAPSVTPASGSTDNILMCSWGHSADSTVTLTVPGSMTGYTAVDFGAICSFRAASEVYTSSSATGTRTATGNALRMPFGVSVIVSAETVVPRESVDITPVGSGAWVTGTSPVSANYPASLQQDDVIYLICSSKPGGTAPTTPTNFSLVGSTQVGSGTAGVGTGPTQVTVFKRVAGSTPPSGTEAVSLTGANVMSTCMQAYRASGTNLQWEEAWWTGSATASATPAIAVTVTASAITAKDVLGWVVSVTDDTATAITHTSEALTGVTFGADVRAPNTTEVSTTGQDIGSAAFYVPITAGPNSGTTLTLTENITAAETSGAGVFRVRATAEVSAAAWWPKRRSPNFRR